MNRLYKKPLRSVPGFVVLVVRVLWRFSSWSFSALLFILISAFVEVAELPIDHLFLVALGATVLV